MIADNRMKLFLLFLGATLLSLPGAHAQKVPTAVLGSLRARQIGPAVMGGRIASLAVFPVDPRVFYVGSAGGGLWKTTNGGNTFKAVFEKYPQSIGAVTVFPTSKDTVWVGTGESWTRNSVSYGNGVYRTYDGGANWTYCGLKNSERIAKIAINPKDASEVYVAVTGALWSSSIDRGVYKTSDAGKTWSKVLYVDDETGCADLAMDPQDPNTIYATMWSFRRKAYTFRSGGPGSGIYKSSDAGKTWTQLKQGLPPGQLGRIAIDVSPANRNVVYASVEADTSGFYRSTDGGASWNRTSTNPQVLLRPFYFSRIVADPIDTNKVYKTSLSLGYSDDGGKVFAMLGNGVHGDHHALWINPKDNNHLILGTDGGLYSSVDRGLSWRFHNVLPISQFYHVSVDNDTPYNVYGGLQDNGSWTGPSRKPGGITNSDWKSVGGGDGFNVLADPFDNNIVYWQYQGGNLGKYRRKTSEVKEIKPFLDDSRSELRFNWNTPMYLSVRTKGVLYTGSQYVHRSKDRGESWERISPDLTTNDPLKQKQEESGGLTIDNSSAENHCTITAIAEAISESKVIWAGTDDGNVQVSRDDGRTWKNVRPSWPGMPSEIWITSIEPDRTNPGQVFVTADGHQTGDLKPYVLYSGDYGMSWKQLVSDTSVLGWAHCIKQDPVNSSMLYLGTESGLYLSFDRGAYWTQFTNGVPPVGVREIVVHQRENDLVLATHGLGVLIIDDITPLRSLTPDVMSKDVHMFDNKAATVYTESSFGEAAGASFSGENPSEVATISYYLKERHTFGDSRLEIRDSKGALIQTIPAGKRRGINRVEWALRRKAPKVPPAAQLAGRGIFGPLVPEGTYEVTYFKGDSAYRSKVVVQADPRLGHSKPDRVLQQQTVEKLYSMQADLSFLAFSLTMMRDSAKAVVSKAEEKVKAPATAFADRLDSLHRTIVAMRPGGWLTGEEQLRERIVELYGAVSSFAGRPSQSQLTRMVVLESQLKVARGNFEQLTSSDLPKLNQLLSTAGLDPVVVPTREQFNAQDR